MGLAHPRVVCVCGVWCVSNFCVLACCLLLTLIALVSRWEQAKERREGLLAVERRAVGQFVPNQMPWRLARVLSCTTTLRTLPPRQEMLLPFLVVSFS